MLKEAGAKLVETKLPAFPYGQVLSTILAAEEGSIFEPLIAGGPLDQLADQAQIAGLRASLDVLAKDYLKAMRIRALAQKAFAALFAEVDALIAPGRTGPATRVEEPLSSLRPPAAAPAPATADPGFAAIITAGNLAGLPALVLPCGVRGQSAGGPAGGGSALLGEPVASRRPRVPEAAPIGTSAAHPRHSVMTM